MNSDQKIFILLSTMRCCDILRMETKKIDMNLKNRVPVVKVNIVVKNKGMKRESLDIKRKDSNTHNSPQNDNINVWFLISVF